LARNVPVPLERIASAIHLIRGHRVMLDSDLAVLYGVSTKRLNEQVRRNRDRFPDDFAFKLSAEEAATLRSQFATTKPGQVVRTFVQLRGLIVTHAALARRLDELERKYDSQFQAVFQAIRELMEPPAPPRKRIGFQFARRNFWCSKRGLRSRAALSIAWRARRCFDSRSKVW
jgi:hypothetical protein